MATKVTILGDEQKKTGKPIEFVKCVTGIIGSDMIDAHTSPSDYSHVELIARAAGKNCYDVMFAYDDDRCLGEIYLGHFNDGIVR